MPSRSMAAIWNELLPPAFLLPRFSIPNRLTTTTTITTRRGIKSISKPKVNSRYNRGRGLPVLNASVEAALKRREATTPLRTGALAIKKGMSGVYDAETGQRSPCTIVQMDRVQVVSHKNKEKHGYYAVQLGMGWKHYNTVNRALLGQYAQHNVSPKRHLVEFKVRDASGLLGVGALIEPSWFRLGQFVDARANCKGKGFAGGMKRHGFHGQDRSHGVSLTHRSMGSAGQSQGGGSRVYPGKKMAGRMGGQQVTVQNVKVLGVDDEKGIVVLQGCIPGPNGCLVKLSDAIKKPWPDMSAMEPKQANLAAEAVVA